MDFQILAHRMLVDSEMRRANALLHNANKGILAFVDRALLLSAQVGISRALATPAQAPVQDSHAIGSLSAGQEEDQHALHFASNTRWDEPTHCPECKHLFRTKYQAKKHFMRVHYTGPKDYGCERCGKAYAIQEGHHNASQVVRPRVPVLVWPAPALARNAHASLPAYGPQQQQRPVVFGSSRL